MLCTQILRIDPSQVERIGQKEVIRLEDRVLPLLRLGEALSLPNPPDSSIQKPPVLILQLGDRRLALAVDRLIEAREVVVKNLGNVLRRVHGVTGATLMGDGSVVLIVNPSDLVDEPTRLQRPSLPAGRTVPNQAAAALDVLVVDDSVSVRRVLANLLKTVGWNPIGAKKTASRRWRFCRRAPRSRTSFCSMSKCLAWTVMNSPRLCEVNRNTSVFP